MTLTVLVLPVADGLWLVPTAANLEEPSTHEMPPIAVARGEPYGAIAYAALAAYNEQTVALDAATGKLRPVKGR